MKIKGGARRVAALVKAGADLHIKHGEPWTRRAWIKIGEATRLVRYRHAVKAAAFIEAERRAAK